MAKKAFRFGVVTGGHPSRAAWIALAQRAEELGYSSLLIPDVLGTPLATLTISYIQIQEKQLENFLPVFARLNSK